MINIKRKIIDFKATKINYSILNQSLWEIEYKEFVAPYDLDAAHYYPLCPEYAGALKVVRTSIKRKFTKFPKCCSGHSNLLACKELGLKKADFKEAPEMAVRKIFSTYSHILKKITAPDWYEDITDYIEYVATSFGVNPPLMGGPLFISAYVSYVKTLMGNTPDIPLDKKEKVNHYLDCLINGNNDETNYLNFSDINTKYIKWLNLFPFEHIYFRDLKRKFLKFPDPFERVEKTNRYTGINTFKGYTKESFEKFLIDITNSLLVDVNGSVLYSKGLLTDIGKAQLDTLQEKRKLQLKEGYAQAFTDERTIFRDMLNKWFVDEADFLKELSLLVGTNPVPQKVQPRPCFKNEAIEVIWGFLKDFFSEPHQQELKRILETGDNAKEPLVFKDNGNRLADAFGQLKGGDFITGVTKKELEGWCMVNFRYMSRAEVKQFTGRYLNGIISSNQEKCMNPLINVRFDKTRGQNVIEKG